MTATTLHTVSRIMSAWEAAGVADELPFGGPHTPADHRRRSRDLIARRRSDKERCPPRSGSDRTPAFEGKANIILQCRLMTQSGHWTCVQLDIQSVIFENWRKAPIHVVPAFVIWQRLHL